MPYNLRVPTPFYHLSLAYEIMEHPSLPQAAGALLHEQPQTFLFGKTAPDVQVVAGLRREATHFFDIPPNPDRPAWKRLLQAHPDLSRPAALPATRAAFLAGYFCHLQADEIWISDLFMPFFGPDAPWADFRRRLFLHNVLRAYLDREVLAALPPDTGERLHDCRPGEWLPFAGQDDLAEWRDYLSGQLQPGAKVLTAEVFAGRQGVEPGEFNGLLDSEERMQAEVFDNIPRHRLVEFRKTVVAKNLQLIDEYLSQV